MIHGVHRSNEFPSALRSLLRNPLVVVKGNDPSSQRYQRRVLTSGLHHIVFLPPPRGNRSEVFSARGIRVNDVNRTRYTWDHNPLPSHLASNTML